MQRFLLIVLFVSCASANFFVLEPKHINVVDLKEDKFVDITLGCKANFKRAKYQWKKDGEDILEYNRHQPDKNGNLTILRVRDSDGGKYQCLASTDDGTALSNVGFVVPKFLRTFSDEIRSPVTTKQGVGLQLTCDGANFAPENSVHFSWEKKLNFERFEYPGTPEYHVSQINGTLYLSNPTTADSDVYSCYIAGKDEYFNIHMEHHSPGVDLTVTSEEQERAPTMILQVQPTTYGHIGGTSTLECFAGGNPTPTIHWKKVNDSLPPSHVITSSGQLELYDVTSDMAGVYECEATNKFGSATLNGRLVPMDKPNWVKSIFSQTVLFRETAKFTCEAFGIPSPTYRWLKNGANIEMTSRVSVSVGTEGGSVMTIAEVGEDDVAIYQCVAENIAGSLYSNAMLKAIDVLFLREPKNKNVTLVGGSKQVKFVCETNSKNGTHLWLKDDKEIILKEDSRYQTNENGALTISALKVSDAGNYRCLVKTGEGSALSNAGKLVITYMNDFGLRSKLSYITETGNGIALPCEVSNYAPDNSVFFVWESINAFIVYGNPGRADYYVSQNGTLYFANPKTDLTDKYYCFIRDKWNLPSGRRIEKSSKYVTLEVTAVGKRVPPKILLEPKNVTYAKVGSTVMLECFAGGNPTPTLMWTKVNGLLPSNHVITEAGQLEIHDVTHDVTGTYQCTASNKLGIETTRGEIIVSGHVHHKRRILSQTVDFHKTATFTCEASGIPAPTYRWLKNGKLINTTSRVSVSVSVRTEGGSVITIAEVDEDDVAIYQCVAQNPLGSLISNAVLKLNQLAPHLVTRLELRIVKASENRIINPAQTEPFVTSAEDEMITLVDFDVQIACTVEGYPKPHIYWTKNGFNITNNVNILYFGSLTEGSLLIQSASKSDEGTYSCTATNYKGTITSTRRLIIYEPTVARAVVGVLRGQNETLQCKELHDKRLKVSWSWARFESGEETDLDNAQGNLQLQQVGNDKGGPYKCCVSTVIGQSCASIHLYVADPPSPPTNVYVTTLNATSQRLEWTEKSSDVIKYNVGGRLSDEDNWFTFDCDVNKPCIASNLLPYNSYVYRVYSINKYGMSKASGISKPQRTMEGAPSFPPSDVHAQIGIGTLLVTWKLYPRKYYGSTKVVYTVAYRYSYNTTTGKESNLLTTSEWSTHNETQMNATSTSLTLPDAKSIVRYEVKVQTCNEFGKSPFSKKFTIAVTGTNESQIGTPLRWVAVSLATAVFAFLMAAMAVWGYRRTKVKPVDDSLIRQYVTSVKAKHLEEANCVAVELQLQIKGEVTAEDWRKYGEHLQKEQKYIESILFFKRSSAFYATDRDTDKSVKGIKLCVEGLKNANEKLLKYHYLKNKHIVRDHVIPLMREMATTIKEKKNGDKNTRVLNLVWCLHHIEYSEGLIGDLTKRKEIIRKAVDLMNNTFESDATNHVVYAHCLYNLGYICEEAFLKEDAETHYKQALDAYGKAKDVSETDKNKWKKRTIRSLGEESNT